MYTETTDGHRINLDYIEPSGSAVERTYCVLAHGIFTNRDEDTLVALATALGHQGVGSVRFDFRGHGASAFSSRTFSPVAALEDLQTVVSWAHNNADVVHLVGSSFGGSTSILYCALRDRMPISRLALLNPVVDYDATFLNPRLDWGRELFSPPRREALVLGGSTRLMPHFVASANLYRELALLHPETEVEHLPKDALVIHGSADEKVPVERTVEVMKGIGIEVDVIDGATHGFKEADHHSYVIQRTRDYLTGIVP